MQWRTISVVLRVLMALNTRTFFQPDEFFQSLEVAHHTVFGYGHLTWEWLAPIPIRSVFFPSLWVPVYWLLRITGLHNTSLLILLPKVLAGLLAAVTDVAVYDLASIVLGERYAGTAMFLSWTSFFHALSLVRSMSNSAETSLTTLALAHWLRYCENALDVAQRPERRLDTNPLMKAMIFAALATMIRPTNAIVWVFAIALLLWRLRSRWVLVTRTLVICMWFANTGIGLLILLDSFYYGRITVTPINFLMTNLSSVSLFYGGNPWHYYVTQAVPIMCTTTLPYVVHGLHTLLRVPRSTYGHERTLASLVAWTIAVYSLAGHKEWRFIHPVLPILHVFAARSFKDLTTVKDEKIDDETTRRGKHGFHKYLVLLSIPAMIYVMCYHGRAQVSVIADLRHRPGLRSVGFLMPCHSTPWQSHLHRPDLEGHIWALGCEPPLRGEKLANYRDQTRVFYDAPAAYLRQRFPRRVDTAFPPSPQPTTPAGQAAVSWKHTWPSHLVMFRALLAEDGVRALLLEMGYRETERYFNGWEEDPKRRGGVQLWHWDEAAFQQRFAHS